MATKRTANNLDGCYKPAELAKAIGIKINTFNCLRYRDSEGLCHQLQK